MMAKLFGKSQDPSSKQTNTETEEEVAVSQKSGKLSTESKAGSQTGEWLNDDNSEGQLSVDVYQNENNIIIRSTIAGVKPEDIDISINGEMVTIRGERRQEEEIREEDYFYQECYWGAFSRSIILPVEVKPEEAEASLKNGVLTLVIPKAEKSRSVSVQVKSE